MQLKREMNKILKNSSCGSYGDFSWNKTSVFTSNLKTVKVNKLTTLLQIIRSS